MKLWSLVAAVILTFGLGFRLATISFKQPRAPDQAFVTVFTKEKTASVSLKVVIHPLSPWKDWLTVHVNGTHGTQERWLLVVQCPAVLAAPAHTVALYPEADTQLPGASATVTVWEKDEKTWAGYLGCFSAQASRGSNDASAFANATLPGLETDPAMAASQEAPQLYAERGNSSRRIEKLFEVFPECQTATPSTATINPPPTGIASQRPVANTPGSLPPAASPPTVGTTTASPNPGDSGCSSPQSNGTTLDVYQLPASVVATETLQNVNLSGYRIESIFPPGQFGKRDQITWQGISSLSPSLLTTNVTVEHRLGWYTFLSGVVFGVGGGALITLLVEGFDASRERRKKKEEEEKGYDVTEKRE